MTDSRHQKGFAGPASQRAVIIFPWLMLHLVGIAAVRPVAAQSSEIRIAVASNFSAAARALAKRFEDNTGQGVTLIFGSSGKHYAQIVHGADIDVFLSADVERAKKLEEDGRAVPESRFTYARGRLVLWSADSAVVDPAGRVLENGDYRFLAIAQPRLAPYGRAARELLESLGLWRRLDGRMVRGENVGQAFQFAVSGNAELGLVSAAQILSPEFRKVGSTWTPPDSLYAPIEQQAVLLTRKNEARTFLEFLRSPEGQAIIRQFGYDIE